MAQELIIESKKLGLVSVPEKIKKHIPRNSWNSHPHPSKLKTRRVIRNTQHRCFKNKVRVKKSFSNVQFNDWVYDKTKWCMKFSLTLVSFFVILHI